MSKDKQGKETPDKESQEAIDELKEKGEDFEDSKETEEETEESEEKEEKEDESEEDKSTEESEEDESEDTEGEEKEEKEEGKEEDKEEPERGERKPAWQKAMDKKREKKKEERMDKLEEGLKTIKSTLETLTKESPSEAVDDAEKEVEKILEKYKDEANPELVKDIIKLARAGKPTEALKKIEEGLGRLDQLVVQKKREVEDSRYANLFRDKITPLIKEKHPKSTDKELKAIEDKLKGFYFLKKYTPLTILEVYDLKFKELSNLVSSKTKTTIEKGKTGAGSGLKGIDLDKITDDEYEALSSEDQEKVNEYKINKHKR